MVERVPNRFLTRGLDAGDCGGEALSQIMEAHPLLGACGEHSPER